MMSLEDNSVTQLATPEEPAATDSLDAVDRPLRFADEEAVPLRDPATLAVDGRSPAPGTAEPCENGPARPSPDITLSWCATPPQWSGST